MPTPVTAPCGCRITGRFAESNACTETAGRNLTGTQLNQHVRTVRARLARAARS